MNLTISGHHLEVTPALREYVLTKLDRVTRHFDQVVDINVLLSIEKTVAEGAGATGFAALLQHPEMFKGRKVGVVLSGGNIDPRLLANVIMRELSRERRVMTIAVEIEDRPGILAAAGDRLYAARLRVAAVGFANPHVFAATAITQKDNPLAVGRDLRKAVAISFRRSPSPKTG